MLRTHTDTHVNNAQVEVGKVDTAKFDDAYFKSADKKKGASKKTEGEFFNEVRSASCHADSSLVRPVRIRSRPIVWPAGNAQASPAMQPSRDVTSPSEL